MRIRNLFSFAAFVTLVMSIIIGGITQEEALIKAGKEATTNIYFSPLKQTTLVKPNMPFLISNF